LTSTATLRSKSNKRGEVTQFSVRVGRYHRRQLGGRLLRGRRALRAAAGLPVCRAWRSNLSDSLVQTSRVSDPAFVQAMSAFVRKAVGAEGSVDKAEVLKTVEVIADPKTLLPYRTVVKETKTFAVSAKGEAPRTSVEIEESVTTYSY
jgi:hypothetical protein